MLSVYARELLAVQLGLFQFWSPLRGRTVVVFCDDSTAVHSLRKGGAPGLLTHPDWSLHMTVFLFLRRLWPVQMFSLPPRPLIVVRFTSPLSGISGQRARTRFSRSGTAFGLTRSLRWLSSACYREAPGIHGDGTHSCDSPLGSAPLVFRPGPALADSSSDPTVPSIPPALDSV